MPLLVLSANKLFYQALCQSIKGTKNLMMLWNGMNDTYPRWKNPQYVSDYVYVYYIKHMHMGCFAF